MPVHRDVSPIDVPVHRDVLPSPVHIRPLYIYIKHKTFSIFLPPINYKLLFLHHLSSGVVFGVAEITG